MTSQLDTLSVNTIRTLSIDGVQKANSGHPGLPLGAAPMAYVLWQKHLRHNPKNPLWADRDRFVLSAGHGSMLLYSLLHLTGYDSVSMDDLKAFRQWGSRTPGHPEYEETEGVEATTGPLGQGISNAVGMAIAERALASVFNKDGSSVVGHHTYVLCGDGDLMEGVASEACSLAGHLKLGRLIVMYDANNVTLDGPASQSFDEDVGKRFEAYGWHVQYVKDGDTDYDAIDKALSAAKKDGSKPHMIIITTTIGYGSPKAGTSKAHGSPLGADGVKETKKKLGWDPEKSFFVPDEALKNFRSAIDKGAKLEADWNQGLKKLEQARPDLATQWKALMAGELPKDWDKNLPVFKTGESLATREAGGKAINAVAKTVPWLIGGDADLSESTKTHLDAVKEFDGEHGTGGNIHFGVREHAMAAAANGIAYHRGLHPYVATFFTFSDYMRPAVRIAALAKLSVTFVWTHDSVGLGEDGPTHQPVEHLMSLRAMPNMVVMRPGDANETVEAWRYAMEHKHGPVGLVLSRQKLPTIDRTKFAPASGTHKGAYVLGDAKQGKVEAIILATGSELDIAMKAYEKLAADGVGVRLVSIPSWELFAKQDDAYRESVLPKAVTARVSIEAGVTFGWTKWIGDRGIAIGVDRFGASAPAEVIYEKFGITAEAVISAVKKLTR
ncbi:MAG: transketolase [Clostridia bacterium]|nr:transketolase [Deltaproteobacteria bacterium]